MLLSLLLYYLFLITAACQHILLRHGKNLNMRYAQPIRHHSNDVINDLPYYRDNVRSSISGNSGRYRRLFSDNKQILGDDAMLQLQDYIVRVQQQPNCSRDLRGSLSKTYRFRNNFPIPSSALKQFHAQVKVAVKIATLLNSLFVSPEAMDVYNDKFYQALVRANVQADNNLHGCTIVFEANQYKNRRRFAPRASRNDKGVVSVTNLEDVYNTKYFTAPKGYRAYEWFWAPRNRTYQNQYDCGSASGGQGRVSRLNISTAGQWSEPYFSCALSRRWLITYSVPFFGCTNQRFTFKGVVAVDVELNRVDINQCLDTGLGPMQHCKKSTQCETIPRSGFKPGAYRCRCADGFFLPGAGYYNGTLVEQRYREHRLNSNGEYERNFTCFPCAPGCKTCTDLSPCLVQYDVLKRGVPLGLQSFCMTICLVLGGVIMQIRRNKVMKASMWIILEVILVGAILLYATVIIQYFEPSDLNCLVLPWFREVGFATLYGCLILKIYRVLAEFQSRKAHRVHVRDRDLLKYCAGIVLVVIGYMSTWTAINIDHLKEGRTMLDTGETQDLHRLKFVVCKTFWWDYVVEIGEFLFLCFGVYLCYCIRAAPSDYGETRYVTWAIYNETVVSAILHIIRHFLWLGVHPDYLFIMYFVRCQFTVSINLILVLGPKLWYAHRPPDDDHFRNRAYSSSDVHEAALPESMKLHGGISSNGDVDIMEVNLSEMDPEDIRSELKRVYTQLQIYKTKTMRKDNPHISKRRGGRKQTHRRFSLQAFHYTRKHHRRTHEEDSTFREDSHVTHCGEEASKTPEESTNSGEGMSCAVEDHPNSSAATDHRQPTVSFKSTVYK